MNKSLPNHVNTWQSAKQNNLISCHVCISLNQISDKTCRTCFSKLHSRQHNSLQFCLAFLLTGIVLYFPANLLPIMHNNLLGQKTASTILGGVVTLWQHGSYPIAMIIFITSVLIPIAKILALVWLCYGVHKQRFNSHSKNTRLYRLTEFIGRWSMVDVFVVAVLVALIQMGNLMSITPGVAAIAFAGMVISTMLSAMFFDPRLIWDTTSKF